jgi:hypothetical protein
MNIDEVRQNIDDAIAILSVPVDPNLIDFAERMSQVFKKYGYNTNLVDSAIRLSKIPPPVDCLRRLQYHPLLLRLIGRFS